MVFIAGILLSFIGGSFIYVVNNLMLDRLVDVDYVEIVAYLYMLRVTYKTMSADLRKINDNE